MRRRDFITLIGGTAGAAAIPGLSQFAKAQTYPTRPVRVIVPFAPGSATDLIGRLIAQKLSENAAFGRAAEVHGRTASAASGAYDPKPSIGRRFCCGAQTQLPIQ